MSDKTVVLITGVADYWGARVAERLVEESHLHVIGLDREPPAEEIAGLDFIQADMRNSLLVELLAAEQVAAVCHLKFVESVPRSEGIFDLNVMGTMKVLEACAEAGVSKAVVKSSTAVYGAHPDNSALLTEEVPLRGSRRYGYTRDLVEIEAFCNGFQGQAPQTALTVLRFANIVGLEADTPMTRFLRQQPAPILLGFDPMLQFIHEDDVVEALAFAVLNDVPGVYNVAAEGPIPLTRLLSLVRRVPLPLFHPLAYWGVEHLRGTRFDPERHWPLEPDYLRYPWVGDLTRMGQEMGFMPAYTAAEALREFAGPRHGEEDDLSAGTLAYDEDRLRDIIERRRRVRERQAAETGTASDDEEDE
jgi:UDP-glucose 4-epimerase